MKKFFYLILALSIVSCSKDDGGESQKSISENLVGLWKITKITYDNVDDSPRVVTEGCSIKSDIGFSVNGTFIGNDYEGNDINDCYHFIFEGSWRMEQDPDNSNNNLKIRVDKEDGQSTGNSWGYAKISFSGNDKMTTTYTHYDGDKSIYEYERIN